MDIDREATLNDPGINQKAEGKIFAGSPQTAIKSDELRVFDFDSPDQLINIVTNEFSARCEFSGIPDQATLRIKYYPTTGKAVELKSLKYYMISFRDVLIFQERACKRIYADLKKILNTDKLLVELIYNTRGGFDVTCSEGSL